MSTNIIDERFAGLPERDQDSALDFAPFRTYNPTMMRWLSPDPAGLAAANPANPQSWNRYAYVLNNPLIFSDPLGLVTGPPEDPWCDPWLTCPPPCLPEFGDICPPLPPPPSGGGGGAGGGSTTSGAGTMPGNAAFGLPITCRQVTVVIGGVKYPAGPLQCSVDPFALIDTLTVAWDIAYGRALGTLGNFFKGRPPGQSFGACVASNINLTTGGLIPNSTTAAAVTGAAGATRLGLTHLTISGAPASAYLTIVAGAYAGVESVPALVLAAGSVSQGVAVVGGAASGLFIGSAANCASVGVGP